MSGLDKDTCMLTCFIWARFLWTGSLPTDLILFVLSRRLGGFHDVVLDEVDQVYLFNDPLTVQLFLNQVKERVVLNKLSGLF